MSWVNRRKLVETLVLFLLVVFTISPLLCVLVSSFQTITPVWEGDFSTFIYNHFSFTQYKQLMIHDLEYWIMFANTFLLAAPVVVLAVLFATLSAYGLRTRTRCSRAILFVYIILSLLPMQVLLIPNFIALSKLNLIGSRTGTILVLCFQPCYTYLVYRFSVHLPTEMFEAARLEGAGELCVYRKIMLPQIMPAITAIILVALSDCWSILEQPLVFIQDTTKYPLSVLFREIDDTIQLAGGIMYAVPVFVFVLTLGKELAPIFGDWR